MTDKYIQNLDKRKIGDVDENVATLLERAENSHDPIFIFERDRFLGLVWPYQMLYSGRPARGKGVKTILIRPPTITAGTDIYEVTNQMLSLRSYVLPVFDNEGRVTGVVRATDILGDLVKRNKRDEFFERVVVDKVVAVKMADKVRKIMPLLRKGKFSRVVVVDEKGRLAGVVSRRDIYRAMVRPTAKQRYAARGGDIGQLLFDQEWGQKMDYPMSNLLRNRRVEFSMSSHPKVWLKQLLEGNAGSVVMVDRMMKPRGSVSVRTFLKAFLAIKPKSKPVVNISDTNKLLSRFQIEAIRNLLERYLAKIANRFGQVRLDAAIKALKNPAGKVSRYELRLELKRVGKKVIRSLAKGRRVWDVVREGLVEIKKQIRRD